MTGAVVKSIQLTTEPFDELLRVGETIDYRLDQPQWDCIALGSHIEFWEDLSGWDKAPQPNARSVRARVTDIFRASSFSELLDQTGKGHKEEILPHLKKWWSQSDIKKYGVKAFKVCVV